MEQDRSPGEVVTLWGAPKLAPFHLGIQPDTESGRWQSTFTNTFPSARAGMELDTSLSSSTLISSQDITSAWWQAELPQHRGSIPAGPAGGHAKLSHIFPCARSSVQHCSILLWKVRKVIFCKGMWTVLKRLQSYIKHFIQTQESPRGQPALKNPHTTL